MADDNVVRLHATAWDRAKEITALPAPVDRSHVALVDNDFDPGTFIIAAYWTDGSCVCVGIATDYGEGCDMARSRAFRLRVPAYDYTRSAVGDGEGGAA
ncbi:MAG: hypothetical protein K0S56_1514 [Microvirga sp.]|jgi:hypothetical protein|nr:hypothetical protein [Microvirga sp.]